MATHVTHILDERTPAEGVRLLSLLLQRLPAAEVRQRVIVVGRSPVGLVLPEGVERLQVGRRLNWVMASVLDLQRVLKQHRPDVVWAWNLDVAAASRVAWRGDGPMAVTICDPGEADSSSRWRRSANGRLGGVDVFCTSKQVQRRLVESGVPVASTTVIRPGVDFGQLRQAKQSMNRADLGLPANARVLLTTAPPTRTGGQFHAVWATAILHHIWPDARLLIPGRSREQRRIGRLIENIYCPQAYCLTGDRYSLAELLAVSDVLVVPALGDVPAGDLAWAMAAGVPIVASAVPAVAEFIADQQNGFLCPPSQPHTLATRIRTVVESADLVARCTDAAQAQAFEIFRAERCLEEYRKVIDSLARGERTVNHVQDAAINA